MGGDFRHTPAEGVTRGIGAAGSVAHRSSSLTGIVAEPAIHLDDPARGAALRGTISRKAALHDWYLDVYRRYAECIARTPAGGLAIELGSGAGFAQDVIPELVTTDVLPYENVDRVVDATAMPFVDGELRFIAMLNVFHHIRDPAAFLAEAQRCLAPGGRMLIVDQHVGVVSKPILRHAHHEPFRPEADRWQFESSGPLSGANGALAWIVFRRDLMRFCQEFPGLELSAYTPHTPLRYWLAGGLKPWSLLTRRTGHLAAALDRALIRVAPDAGSFVDVELVRRAGGSSPWRGLS